MGEIASFTVIVGDLTGPLFIRYRTVTKKISKETGLEELTNGKLTRFNRHIQKTLPNNRIHILLKCT